MVGSVDSTSQQYFTNEGVKSEVYLSAKSVREHVVEYEKVINKVHSILKSLNIPVNRYDSELTELRVRVPNLSECLKRTCIKNFDLDDSFSIYVYEGYWSKILFSPFVISSLDLILG